MAREMAVMALLLFSCLLLPKLLASTPDHLPNISSLATLDSSLMREQSSFISINILNTLSLSSRTSSECFWKDWRLLARLIALDNLREAYISLSTWYDRKVAIFEQFISIAIDEKRSPEDHQNSIEGINRLVLAKSPLTSFYFMSETFSIGFLCDSLQQTGFFCDPKASLARRDYGFRKELYRRCAFCENTWSKNTEYGLSAQTVALLDSIERGSVPILVDVSGSERRFIIRRRDLLAEDLFEFLSGALVKRTSFRVKLPSGRVVVPKEFFTVGMRLSTFYLLAHHPNDGYLHIVALE